MNFKELQIVGAKDQQQVLIILDAAASRIHKYAASDRHIGSTRPGRNGEAVAKWVYEIASKRRADAEFEYVVNIKDYDLPLLDEPAPPSMGRYSKEHTKRWAAKIYSFDAFVFVTPEYNHATSGALKNAIDFLSLQRVKQQGGRVCRLWRRRRREGR